MGTLTPVYHVHAAPAATAHGSSLVPIVVAAALLIAAALVGALLAARR